jgi:hypothetical protein
LDVDLLPFSHGGGEPWMDEEEEGEGLCYVVSDDGGGGGEVRRFRFLIYDFL